MTELTAAEYHRMYKMKIRKRLFRPVVPYENVRCYMDGSVL